MKQILTFSLLFTKLGLLLCFGVMGFFVNTADATTVPSCHQEMPEINQEAAAKDENCDACEVSENTWSQQFIQEHNELSLLTILKDIPVSWIDIVLNKPNFLQEISSPDPPPDTKILYSHLIIQKVVLFLL